MIKSISPYEILFENSSFFKFTKLLSFSLSKKRGEFPTPCREKGEERTIGGGGVPHQILLFLIEKHYKRNEIQERYLPKGGIKI